MNWWQERPMRLVQTNLREIDIPLDPKIYTRVLRSFNADVALFNVGGIVANYPTRLPFHFTNPRLDGDMVAEVLVALHEEGIRMIGRFDFSKVNEALGAHQREWLYKGLDGEPVTYNGQMQCCVNGTYQQQHSIEILREALERYALDGVFFNMIGYQTTDYSGIYHGICQCDQCRKRFGEDLPRQEDRQDPIYLRYLRFCQETGRELFLRIRDTIRAVRPNCAICTYTNDGVDIIRSESNSGIRRPQPEFVYESSLNVRRVLGSWPGLASSNAAVHFIDFPYRHAGVAPALTARRLAQNFIHGGWMDYYVIGKLDEQQDRACQPAIRQLFTQHLKADRWLAGAMPLADVVIIAADQASPGYNPDELKGLVTLLSEAHRLYDVVEENALEQMNLAERFRECKLIILPDIVSISPPVAKFLDEYVAGGGKILLTGASGTGDKNGLPTGGMALRCAGVVRAEIRLQERGAYFAARDGDQKTLTAMEEVDWIPLDTPWVACTPDARAMRWLQYVPVGMFGPPEKCYYTVKGNEPGLIANSFGKGVCAVIPWQIGSQQARFPTHAIARLFRAVFEAILDVSPTILVNAPETVEVSAFRQADGKSIVVGIANLSGQNGRAVHDPLPIYDDIRVGFPAGSANGMAEALSGESYPVAPGSDGRLWVTLPRLDLCEMLSLSYSR